jgi:TolA-binding protein
VNNDMRNTGTWLLATAAGITLAISMVSVHAQDAQSEQLARLQYRAGMAFLADNKTQEALKDFEKVVELYPRSSVAGAALLQIAQCQLDAGAIDKADAAVERLQKFYSTSESASMGMVLAGRILLAKNRSAANVESAISSYRRVGIMFEGSSAVPAAIYYTGEALRLSHRDDEAIRSYRQVSTDYPESEWAPRAMLGEAQCLVLTGRATLAMDVLQRVRQRFPARVEAATTAVAWNTILYRLYLRAPAQPAYQYVAQKSIPAAASRLKDISTMAISATGLIHAANADTVLVFDVTGKREPDLPARETRAILFDRSRQPVLVCKESVVSPEIRARPLGVKKPDGTIRTLTDVASGLLTSGGDLLVVDSNTKNIGRFSSSGTYVGSFASVFPERMAIDVTDRVASIDQDGSGVSIFDHDGRARPKIPVRGQGYEFDQPRDIAFDALGHVYVLDRNKATVWVFALSPQPRLLTGFSVPVKSPGVFRRAVCFALDSAGRLYIYDDDVEKIQVYQ